ncbi:hypothetical protein FFLO_02918 [Filobasidium floriforme]|uniref:Prefoldin subunit 4 n=1 Tax=Filobasidium floriforme TaxID=5210 RepID=A0A8K0NQS7_9TREE|nr:hypothetical protein FFLO_02918 [Filobasidium floriforme]
MRQEDESEGIEVAWEDQQRISAFSKYNTRLSSIQDELKKLQEEKELYDDLEMELELADEKEPVPYQLASTFFHLTPPQALRQLSLERRTLQKDIRRLEKRRDECVDGMKGLKIELYAKFGNQINLETDPKDD